MNGLVDAHLPRRVAALLRQQGHDAIHTRDLPDGNHTSDPAIIAIAAREGRVVATKDADFVQGSPTRRQPPRLLLNATGSYTNQVREALLTRQLPTIVPAFAESDVIELTYAALLVHLRSTTAP